MSNYYEAIMAQMQMKINTMVQTEIIPEEEEEESMEKTVSVSIISKGRKRKRNASEKGDDKITDDVEKVEKKDDRTPRMRKNGRTTKICNLASEPNLTKCASDIAANDVVSSEKKHQSYLEEENVFPSEVEGKEEAEKFVHIQRQYSCLKCSYRTTKKDALFRHLRHAHGVVQNMWFHMKSEDVASNLYPKEDKCTCLTCGKTFKTQKMVNFHARSQHNLTERYGCNSCPHGSLWKEALDEHISKRHGVYDLKERQHSCLKCSYGTTKKDALFRHLRHEHGIQLDLSLHMKSEDVPLSFSPIHSKCTCLTCGKTFKKQTVLNMHAKQAHNLTKRFRCNLCPHVSLWQSVLEKHMHDRHSVNEKDTSAALSSRDHYVFACKLCDKTFPRQSKLEMHVNGVHEKKVQYKCRTCGKCFGWKDSMHRHLRLGHQINAKDFADNYEFFSDVSPEKTALQSPKRKAFKNIRSSTAKQLTAQVKVICEDLFKPESIEGKAPICNDDDDRNRIITSFIFHNLMAPEETYPSNDSTTEPSSKFMKQKEEVIYKNNEDEPNTKSSFIACRFCKKQFKAVSTMELHVNAIHTKTTLYKCEKCVYSAGWKGNVVKHLFDVHGLSIPAQRGKIPHFITIIENHEVDVAAIDKAIEKTKEKGEKATPEAVTKALQLADSNLSCSICGSPYSRSDVLRRHINTAHGNMGYQCLLCCDIFKTTSKAKYHLRKIHGITALDANTEFIKMDDAVQNTFMQDDMVQNSIKPEESDNDDGPFRDCYSSHLRIGLNTASMLEEEEKEGEISMKGNWDKRRRGTGKNGARRQCGV